MGLEEYKGVYVFAQQVDNELSGIAFELLGKAKELASDLGTDVTAVLIGYSYVIRIRCKRSCRPVSRIRC